MNHVIRKLGEGLAGGALATVPMTATMFAAQKLGRMGKQPPQQITDVMLDKADVTAPRRERRVLAGIAHFAFGAGAGALFALVRPGRPTLARAAIEGAAFATGVWAASYAGWVPALGIMPPPQRDRTDRQVSMVIAHWVFGAALGAFVAHRRR